MFYRTAPNGHVVAQCAECESVWHTPGHIQTGEMDLIRWKTCRDATQQQIDDSPWGDFASSQSSHD